ncbi:MAG: WD40 repeat domain-containing protein, partial [Pseudanabaena sp. CAN_BIN31]|nr:WD40 repeat domain-containing protein [Pseudanabaena sp. CAN_BIN31]
MSDRTNIVADNNRDALRRLMRIVTRSQDFSLSIALCNYRVLQKRVLLDLRSQLATEGLPETAIAILELKSDAQTLLAPIQRLMEDVYKLPLEQRPKVLMVLGLDAVKEIQSVLKSANRVREEFANCLEFPMVLWLSDRTQDILTREASDLANWTTAGEIEFQMEAEELQELVQKSTEEMFNRFIDVETRESFLSGEIANSLQQYELKTAIAELECQGIEIDTELRANLDFAFGCINFVDTDIAQTKGLFQKSLAFWRDRNQLKQAICLMQLGLCDRTEAFRHRYGKEQFYQSSLQYFSESIAIFRQLERWDLVAEYINFLTASMEELKSTGLEALATEAISLHQTYPNQLREAHDHAVMASVHLAKNDYALAREFAESAIALYREGEALKLPNLHFSERYVYCKYEIWLARALDGLGDRQSAIARLAGVKDGWSHQYEAQVYVAVLEELRSLYTSAGLYLKAFETKQHQRSIEQQYGLRAFIGAGTLNPKREANNPDMYSALSLQSDGIAQEIEASGRMIDVEELVRRIGQARFPLTVIHGDSGAGKSSILSGGLIPALKSKESVDGRKVLVLLVKNYKDWSGEIKHQLQEYFRDRNPDLDPIHHFKQNIDANYLTVLIFDQFEDFFFKKQEFRDRLPFYKFLKACLHTDFVRVVLSLREDYLHYLLECDRAVDLEKVENDILGKQVRYYLGDFTQDQARQVIEALTLRSQLRLDEDLCDRLVEDLSGEQSRILPIELQVVGAQLESENPPILTLSKYLELTAGNEKRKPSEVLVERWLENVVKDCGVLNQGLAERVLYALTGNEEKRPQKTLTELGLELLTSPPAPLPRGEGSQENLLLPLSLGEGGLGGEGSLSLVIAVLVGSGLVFRVSSTPEDRFQLIHDYLVNFIRKKYAIDVMAELREERKRRERAEKENEILAVANRKARQRIAIGAGFLITSIVVAIGVGGYAGKTFVEQQEAIAGTRLEREGSLLLKQFEFQQLKTLVATVRSVKELKGIVKDRPVETYPAMSPILAIQSILARIRERFILSQGDVLSVVFSSDGKRLATSGSDGTARVWDESGKELAKLQGHQGFVWSVVFSPDGKRLATSGSDGTARVWDESGKELAKLQGHQGDVSSVVFSPDGKRLATSGSDGTARVWDESGKELAKLQGHQGDVLSVVFSPDGKRLATSGRDGTARVWDESGKELA